MIRVLSIYGQCPPPKSNIAADDEYTLQMVESRLLWIWSSHSRAAEGATTVYFRIIIIAPLGLLC